MKKFTRKQWAAGLLLAVSFVLLTFGLVFAITKNGIDSSEAAGWVQAVGSIAAILGAFAIANSQQKNQAREAKERHLVDVLRDATLAKAATQRTLAAVEHFLKALRKWPENTGFKYNPILLNSARELVELSLEHRLPPSLTEVIVSLHNELVTLIQGVDEMQNMRNPMSHSRVRLFTDLWHKNIEKSMIDAISFTKEAEAAFILHMGQR